MADYSLDAYLLDLQAVVDHLDLDRFAFYATIFAGAVAVAYTVHHPERVSHLILSHSFARGSDFTSTPQIEGLRALMEKDWELFTETAANVAFGWSAGEPARGGAAMMRKGVTREALRAVFQGVSELDVTGLLAQVRSPPSSATTSPPEAAGASQVHLGRPTNAPYREPGHLQRSHV